MKVRVAYTVEVDDNFRRAINEHFGREGLATHAQVRNWYESVGHSMDNDLDYPDDPIINDGRDPWEGAESWEAIE
jgi:hypothetical protein